MQNTRGYSLKINFDEYISDLPPSPPAPPKKENRLYYGICFKISNTLFCFLFSTKLFVSRAEIHKMLARIANIEDPDCLIWVCIVCLGEFARQITSMQIFEHLPYYVCMGYGIY